LLQEDGTISNYHYRHVRGGLDKAAAQAEARNLYDLLIVDCDVHISEPYTLFVKSLPESYRKTLPLEDQEDPLYSKQRRISQKTAMYESRVRRPEISFPQEQSADEIIDEFARRMLDLGMKHSLIIPNMIVRLPMDPRPSNYEVEIAKAYVEFNLTNFAKYPEILSVIYVPTKDPQRAAEIIDDYGSEKGISGALISVLTPKRAGTDDWNPIYEAAQKKNLPIIIHGDAIHEEERGWLFGDFPNLLPVHALSFPITIARAITSIVFDGVPERFPNLKFVFMEGGVTFIPWLMQRLDDDYIKRGYEAPLLTKLPSEYMNEFYYTTQPLESAHKNQLKTFFQMFDYENKLLYASDYPHWDFDAPSVIYDLPFLSMTAKKKILGENAAKLFKLN